MPEIENIATGEISPLEGLLTDLRARERATTRKAAAYTMVPIVIVVAFVAVSWATVSRLRRTTADLSNQLASASQELVAKQQQLNVAEDKKRELEKSLGAARAALNDISTDPTNAQEKARRALGLNSTGGQDSQSSPSRAPTRGRATVTITEVEVDRKARLLTYPPPAATMSEEARNKGIHNVMVELRVVLDASGKVTEITVTSSPDPDYGLRENAIEAAKRIKFRPAVKDGRRVSTPIKIQYHFD